MCCGKFVTVLCVLCATTLQSCSAHSGTNRNSNHVICKIGDHNCLKSFDFDNHYKKCPYDKKVLKTQINGSKVTNLLDLCPILLSFWQSVNNDCFFPIVPHTSDVSELVDDFDVFPVTNTSSYTFNVWLYSFISVTLINLCGLFGLLVIPITNKRYYEHLLQFFVALAVGTLCGDALLHLLPHAVETHSKIISNQSHVHNHETILKGLVIMISIVTFFFIEKFAMFCSEWRNRKQRKANQISRVKVTHEGDNVNIVGEKLCKHKYSSFPYCYDDIAVKRLENNYIDKCHNENEHCILSPIEESKASSTNGVNSASKYNEFDLNKVSDDYDFSNLKQDDSNNLQPTRETYTVILREHENQHHGHTHTHVHVHSAPRNLSSVAWMVIMGDGLHNFTDGIAIGAAFTTSITGGFSTTLAVFCHELPHELGDFAVLLKAGMSAKEALFYSFLSSILCYVGMFCGIFLENFDRGSSWTFAVTAGIFLYIALVDLIPELSSSHLTEVGSVIKCILQLAGILTGLIIMTLIAMYEHELSNVFS